MATRRWAVLAAAPIALAGISLSSGAHAASSAGAPVPTQDLLCGMWTTGSDQFSGTSDVDHPSGSSAMGKIYQYHGQTCEQAQSNNESSIGTFTWSISDSNVHAAEAGSSPQAEFGTEHGIANLSTDNNIAAGFNGHITNFDLSSNDNDGDSCTASDGNNRTVYYASGQRDAQNNCSPAGPGNFNTHGGASTGGHFNGKYGTTVYQWGDMTSMSNCKNGSMNYCFEGVIQGFTN